MGSPNSRRAWVREITTTSQHDRGPQSTVNSRVPRLHKCPLLTPTRNTNTQQRRAWQRVKENRLFAGGRGCFGAQALGAAAATPTAPPAARAQRQRSWRMARCTLAGQDRRARAAAAAVGTARWARSTRAVRSTGRAGALSARAAARRHNRRSGGGGGGCGGRRQRRLGRCLCPRCRSRRPRGIPTSR